MADNVGYTEGAGRTIAADEILGVLFQRIKLVLGADGVNGGDVSAANPMPISALALPLPAGAATDAGLAAILAELIAKTEPADQQHAVIDASALPLGASTEATLALIKAKTDNIDAASSTLAKAAAQTDGSQKAVPRGAAKGATAAADLTGTAEGADHQALDVQIYHGGAAKDPTQIRALTNADIVKAQIQDNGGTAITLGQKVMASSVPVVIASDQSAVGVQGGKTNNNAAPGATNAGVLSAIANEALPGYVEGNLVIPASDLRGVLRMVPTPMAVLGAYGWQGITGVYNGLAANTPLYSMRWGDATRFGIVIGVWVIVFTSTAATTAGITERQLVIARSFTVADTGGTAATLTGNNQKRRTSMGTSLVSDMRIGAPLTAGTRTLDGAPQSMAVGWSGLLSTGVVIGASGSSAVGAARSTEGGAQPVALLDVRAGQGYPIVLAQNEGIVVRIGAAQPAAAVQQTLVIVEWLEANKVH